jgi:hypothetical protein
LAPRSVSSSRRLRRRARTWRRAARRCSRPLRRTARRASSASSASCCRRSPPRATSPCRTRVYVAELDLDVVADLVTLLDIRATRPLPRFPSIVRDLSILVADTLLASQLRGTIRSVAPPTLARVAEFDRYQGKGIPDGQVSLSYRLTFLAPDRTLTDAEVDAAMSEVVDALAKQHGAVRR